MEMSTGSKVRVLENFYALDYVMFGKPSKKITTCCPSLVAEYNTTKGALMSVIVEMYKLMKHSPRTTGNVDAPMLMENARRTAVKARIHCKKLVVTEQGQKDVKTSIKKSIRENKILSTDDAIQNAIRGKAFSLAIDNILIARPLTESKNIKALNSTQGQFLEDAYKVLRGHLVEQALEMSDIDNLLSEAKAPKKKSAMKSASKKVATAKTKMKKMMKA